MSDLKKIKDEYLSKLKRQLNLSEINEIKSNLFGKNGLISSQFKRIGSITEKERKKFASDLNLVKDELQNLITTKIDDIKTKEINKKLDKEKILSELQSKRWKKRCNMHIETVELKKENLNLYGYKELMLGLERRA